MQYPNFLTNNSTIGIPAPSDGARDGKKIEKYKYAEKFLHSQHYKTILSKNINNSNRGRSASPKTRGEEINEMFKNNDIDMIICAAGGDFLIECLPFINFDLLKDNLKYVVGFSDPTGILYPITTKYDIATIYGTNFSNFGVDTFDRSHYDILNLLKGEQLAFENYQLYEKEYPESITGREGNNLTEKVYWKSIDEKRVEMEGRLIGGCFDIIAELIGTKYDGMQEFNNRYKDDGIIWYFDNCELNCEETIRVLWRMKEFNYFKYAKGIIFGRFGKEESYYEYDTKSCLEDSILKEFNIPIIYDADISHKAPCLPIINGSIAHIECDRGKGRIEFRME